MDKKLLKAKSLCILLMLVLGQWCNARDLYVSNTATGNSSGDDTDNYVSFTTFRSLLSSHTIAANGDELNVYFDNGVYDVSSVLTFNTTSANVTGLSVNFSPANPDGTNSQVIFDGSTGTTARFIATSNFAMSLTISDVTFKNFSSTGTSAAGANSLFTAGTNSTITLNNIYVYNVTSRRNPFMAINERATLNIENSKIDSVYVTAGSYGAWYETEYTGATLNISNTTFDKCKSLATGGYGYMFWFENASATFTMDRVTISNGEFSKAIIASNQTTSNISITDTKFLNNTATTTNTGTSGIIAYITNAASVKFTDCEFSGNSTTKNMPLMHIVGANISFELASSTISGNTLSGGAASYLLEIENGTANVMRMVYNNTFSNNTNIQNAIQVSNNTIATGGIYNNTFYNSGGIAKGSSTFPVQNNLLITGAITTTNVTTVKRNVFDNAFYADGITNGETIENITNYVTSTLVVNPAGADKPYIHELIFDNGRNPFVSVGEEASLTGYADYLIYDQKKYIRPAKISVGSVDMANFNASPVRVSYLYDSKELLSGETLTIDLSKMDYPDGADKNNVSFEFLGLPANGTLTQGSENYLFSFYPAVNDENTGMPADGIVGVPSTIQYKVSYTNAAGVYFEKINTIIITVINIRQPLGQIDNTVLKCFTDMDSVKFNTVVKYNSSKINGTSLIYDGFSIPLVGDLNGDGFPEIVALGTRASGSLSGWATHLVIMNGQTGEEIVRYAFPQEWQLRDPWHNTPSSIALVDSDRDGKVEIIVATGATASAANKKRLFSYEVNSRTFEKATSNFTTQNPNRLTLKWVSAERYDKWSGGYYDQTGNNRTDVGMPLPQIVDIDADGVPEILVYNKIYNAVDGSLLITLEDLGDRTAYLSNDINAYNSYAYLGRDRYTTNSYDYNLNFSYVYDLDGDGVYEVIAGGKVYYNLDPASGTWQVKSALNINDGTGGTVSIGDGYTAVADVNGDGKAEIIVVSFSNTSNNILRIQVWDPGFMETDGAGGWQKAADPGNTEMTLLAQEEVPFNYPVRYGSHSYVYVGDINGKVQNGKKFPEISILGGCFYGSLATASNKQMPVHPTVPELASSLNANGRIVYSTGISPRNAMGSIMSWTWDDSDDADTYSRLKVSFVLEHQDRSCNTGFTLFDFDNDGMQDIVYRDESYLRIITASKPLIRANETETTSPDVIRFRKIVSSYTGFEYPVIADVNGDGSADIVVMGYSDTNTGAFNASGYAFTIQADLGTTKFAPAPKVWNQFHYSPLKINENLTTPRINHYPLNPEFAFIKNPTTPEIKDYIYNNTITQVVQYSLFKIVNGSDTIMTLSPIVPIPDAHIDSAVITGSNIIVTITNKGDATLGDQTPVKVYRKSVGAPVVAAGAIDEGLYHARTLGKDIPAGNTDTIIISLTALTDPYTQFYIRVTDPSYVDTQTNKFVDLFNKVNTPKQYQDCYWTDNVAQAGNFLVNDDVTSVLQNGTIVIDVLDNDKLPDDCTFTLSGANITTPKGNGAVAENLQGDFGKIEFEDNKIKYTAPASYVDGVVNFSYEISCAAANFEGEGNVYIYILQSEITSTYVCPARDYEINLYEYPIFTNAAGDTIAKAKFEWFTDQKVSLGNNVSPGTLRQLMRDTVFYIWPVNVPGYTIAFDTVQFEIKVQPNETIKKVRWKGTMGDNNWDNPLNWVGLSGEEETEEAITWKPNKCVDVEIPENVDNYPELNSPAFAANITLKNRALITNTHYLDYDSAKVEIKFDTDERDRWVMYSAPLRKTYTGDFMLVKDNKPIYKAVYMSFFQCAHPDNSTSPAFEKAFTNTFGNVEKPLTLGKTFNVWIDSDYDPDETSFCFPSSIHKYDYNTNGSRDSSSCDLSRCETIDGAECWVNGRFIIEEAADRSLIDGSFTIMPPDENELFDLIMVPNPFTAYLDIAAFLNDNADVLQQGYKIWCGEDDVFVSYKHVPTLNGWTWVVDENPQMDVDETLIPPMQSFIVTKTEEKCGSIVNLKYRPEVITTTQSSEGKYKLRAPRAEPEGILHITATINNNSNTTVLVNSPGNSNLLTEEDERKLFYDGRSAVSIYTLTPDEQPLAINVAGNFNEEIPVGIRSSVAGELKLNFSGIEKFGHKVMLRDGDKLINLNATPVYTTSVTNESKNNYFELNNRFALLFETDDETSLHQTGSQVYVMTQDGKMHIISDNVMKSIEITSVTGAIIAKSETSAYSYSTEALSDKIYIVKVMSESGLLVKKVIVK